MRARSPTRVADIIWIDFSSVPAYVAKYKHFYSCCAAGQTSSPNRGTAKAELSGLDVPCGSRSLEEEIEKSKDPDAV